MSNALQDDKGNWSSMRLLLTFLFALVVWMYVDWRWALRLEMLKDVPDYLGITGLFNAMMAGFTTLIAALIIKLVQKRFER